MAENNLAPNKGYYNSDNIIGKEGDFITSPEISQMFGELLGLLVTNYWNLCNKPINPILVDMGGGNGTMMKDCLRAINNVDKSFREKVTPIFIETSNKLLSSKFFALIIFVLAPIVSFIQNPFEVIEAK